MTATYPNLDVLEYLMPKDQARKMLLGDSIPVELEAGFEQLGKLDLNWVWVWESKHQVRGILLAAPCHGSAFIWRLSVLPGEPEMAVGRLLRRFLSDLKIMGISGYITLVNPANETQAQLQAIIKRAGGQEFGTYTLMASAMPKGVW